MRYALFSSLGKISDPLIESFEDLPEDRYLKADRCFRFRAFSAASVKGDKVLWKNDLVFFQERSVNSYAGGVERRFHPLPEEAREFAERLAGCRQVREFLDREEFEMGCHQIRVTADGESPGFPAPEGFHRDGFEYVAVTCVALRNVSGGHSLVRAGDEVIFDRPMAPGETLLLNDREVTHYVSPIMPRSPGRAVRDVMVVTFAQDVREPGRPR